MPVLSAWCLVRSAVRSAECGVPGLARALLSHLVMGWRRFTEIEAWQLSMKLRRQFDAVLDRPIASSDRRFCEDARDASSSVPRNIAEGFGRFGHREFARFVDIARASLLETQTNLIIAKDRRFMSETEFEQLWKLSEEAAAMTTGLLKSLRRRSNPGTDR